MSLKETLYDLFKGPKYPALVDCCTEVFACFIEMCWRRREEVSWAHHVLNDKVFESRRGISNLNK